MHSIRRALVWLCRSRHCRGFGVQSPWAYRFIRYVINEHYPYYSYDDFKIRWGNTCRKERKLCRLYFRISNYLQSPFAVDYSESYDIFSDHVNTGCSNTAVYNIPLHSTPNDMDYILSQYKTIPFFRLSLEADYKTMFAKALLKTDMQSVFIVEGINRNAETKIFWKEIVTSKRYPTTFDLYYCGIIFFNKNRYKENYIVNF